MNNKNIIVLLAVVVFTACSGVPTKLANECPSGRTLLDGVCVREDVADYVGCVKAMSVAWGVEKSKLRSTEVGYIGMKAPGGMEVREKLRSNYSSSNNEMGVIIKQCNNIAFALDANPTNTSQQMSAQKNKQNSLPNTQVIGSWSGPVIEQGRSYYSMNLKIERLETGEYSGKNVYSGGLNCGSLLSFWQKRGKTLIFGETIHKGRGCASGRVEMYIGEHGELHWEWFRSRRGGNPEASAILQRAQAQTYAAVEGRVGVVD